MMQPPKIIVALDYPDADSALAFTREVSPQLCALKIGKELFTAAGPHLVEQLVQQGFKIFLDLKYHDIPNTVAGACRAAANLGVWMVNVHALGGSKMLAAARAALDGLSGDTPLLIGVTLLTSLSADDVKQIGLRGGLEENVLALAKLSQQAGLDGVVCSPREVRLLRAMCGDDFRLVTPGIRLANHASDDQQRTLSPVEAIAAGVNYLVIGRPITRAADPKEALLAIYHSIH